MFYIFVYSVSLHANIMSYLFLISTVNVELCACNSNLS